MNAGAYNSEMKNVVKDVTVLTPNLKVITLTNSEMKFGYRESFLQHYKGILTLSGLSSITGINKVQLSQNVCGRRHPSQKTQQKIKASVIAFAEELSHAMA